MYRRPRHSGKRRLPVAALVPGRLRGNAHADRPANHRDLSYHEPDAARGGRVRPERHGQRRPSQKTDIPFPAVRDREGTFRLPVVDGEAVAAQRGWTGFSS